MKKIVLGSIIAGSVVVTGGIAAGVSYAVTHINPNTPSEKNVDELLEDVYENLRGLPGNDHPTYGSFDAFEDAITKKLTSSSKDEDANLKSEVIKMLNDELVIVMKQVKDDISKASNASKIEFIEKQLSDYADNVTEFTDNLKYGIVGEHDLNYFNEVLNNKVDHSIFGSTKTDIDANVKELDDLYATLKGNVEENLVDIKELILNYGAIEQNIIKEVDALMGLLLNNKKAITALTSSDATATDIINSLTKKYTDVEIKLTQTKQDLATHKAEYDKWKVNQAITTAELSTVFETFVKDLEGINSNIEQLNQATQNSLNSLDIADTTLDLKIDALRTKVDALDTKVENLHTKFALVEEKQNKLIEDNVKNQDDLNNLTTMLNGLTGLTSQLTNDLNTNSNSLKLLKDTLAGIDMTAIHKKIDDNMETIISYSQSVENATKNIAIILDDLNKIVNRANDHETKIYNLEKMVEELKKEKADSGKNVISEYETLYNTGPHLLENKMFLSRNIEDYAKIDIVMMPEHALKLAQVVSFAPEKTKTTGVIQYRGNGAFNGWMMSLLTNFDYNENSIVVKTIQLHGWGNWTTAKLQAIRGWLY